MFRRLIHFLFRRHDWVGTGIYRSVFIDAFDFWDEKMTCDCGAKTWAITRAATRAHIEARW